MLPLTSAPELTTERLVLRGPEPADLIPFTQWMTASKRMAVVGGNQSEAEARFAFQTNIGRWQMDGMGFFTVTLRDDPTALGRVGLLYYPVSTQRDTAEVEVAWFLFDGAEGHGFASEAARAVLAWARDGLGWTRVSSYIDPANKRSQATARRLGATTDGTQAAHNPKCDVWVHAQAAA